MKATLVFRTRILSGFFVLIALLLAVRLYFVQIVHGAQYRTEGMGQYVEQAPDTEERGTIYFTTKDGEARAAAAMQTGWRIAIDPALVVDDALLVTALAREPTGVLGEEWACRPIHFTSGTSGRPKSV